MSLLLALWLALHPAQEEAEALASTDRQDLSSDSAAEHLGAARAAGLAHGVDAALLLAIAWHESAFRARTITEEPRDPRTGRRRVSCGAMTPTPQRRCSEWELTAVGGYDAGAAHLRFWLDRYRGSEWAALTAYAGGAGLVTTCRRTGRWIAPSGRNACDVAGVVRARAAVIRRALGGAS